MTQPTNYRKKPIVIQAIQWTGTNAADLDTFTNGHFNVFTETDRANCDDPDATAEIFDTLHSTWVLTQTGDWIIRGVSGEFYPCRDAVFAETYELAEVAA